MEYLMDGLLFLGLFFVLKLGQILISFAYTTYKSITFHKSLEHAFHPPFSYRLKYGLMGDIMYFIAGILIAFFASDIRTFLLGS